MDRFGRSRVTPLTVFGIWLLLSIFVIGLVSAQGPCAGWSLETEIASRLGGTMYMYDYLPPLLSLAADSEGKWHLAYKVQHLDMYGGWHWWDEILYLNEMGLAKSLVSTWEAYGWEILTPPGIAVDSFDQPAIVYGLWDWMSASWAMYLVTEPAVPEPSVAMIADGLTMYIAMDPALEPSICFDPADDWHVAYATREWTPGGTESRIYHLTATTSEQVASSLLFYHATGWVGDIIGSPSISADLDGYLHVAFVRQIPQDASTLDIADNAAGSWSLPQTLHTLMADNVEFYSPRVPIDPSLVIDDTANWNLAWIDGYLETWDMYEGRNYLMLGTAGAPACSLVESLRMYESFSMYDAGWVGEWVGPAALARDAGGTWHLAYAWSEPGTELWSQRGDWRIVHRTKGLPGAYYWCHIAGPTSLTPGETAAYTVSYGVAVSDPASCDWPVTVDLTADLPSFLLYVSDDSGLPMIGGGNYVEWQASLMANESRTFHLTAGVPSDAASDVGQITLTAAGDCFSPGSSGLSVMVTRPEVDLSVSKSIFGQPRPGFYSTYYISAYNLGNTAAPGVTMADWLSTDLEFVSATPGGVYDPDTHTVFWHLGTFAPWEWRSLRITVRTPIPLPLSTVVSNTVCIGSLTEWETDFTNNCYLTYSTVIGSWDPNDKSVTPAGVVSAGERLTYFVEFENEGTADAINVRVVDFLDPALDDTTLMGLGPEASYNASTREIVWDFPDIYLQPDECRVLDFSVCTRAGLDAGTEIDNQALVYFDFNPPIATPTVTNVIGGGAMEARIFLSPRVLNLRSKAPVVRARLEIQGDYSIADVDLASLMLIPGSIPPLDVGVVGDQSAGKASKALRLTFDRAALMSALPPTDPVTVVIAGAMQDGTSFSAADSIRVLGF